jgi:hypothetical protein
VLACIGSATRPSALAQERFDIRSAYIERAEGVYQLNATLSFDIGEGARAPCATVRRSRCTWRSWCTASAPIGSTKQWRRLDQSYELVYHALSDRYLVRNCEQR